jgi:2-polyprenyl-3-methyl-5-hydroxy-6-metoxy-1,4-benzoquinol methylase
MTLGNPIWTDAEIRGDIEYGRDVSSVAEKNAWHHLFESPKWILLNPADEVLRFFRKYVEHPERQIAQRTSLSKYNIHDLGCGGGRHVFYFSELGFDVTGSDLSDNALEYTRAELKRRGLEARLVKCPMTDLPFENGEFDITISRAVINHSTLQDLKRIVYEVARTTKPGGLFFSTFSSERASDWKKGIEVLKDITYIPTEGPEQGLVHTYLNATNLAALLEPFFRIEEVYLYEHPPWVKDAPNASPGYFGSEYVAIGVRR